MSYQIDKFWKLHFIRQKDCLDLSFVAVFNDCPSTDDIVVAIKISYLFPESAKYIIRDRISGRVTDTPNNPRQDGIPLSTVHHRIPLHSIQPVLLL